MPATERATLTLRLEGVPEERIVICPPGIDVGEFEGERPPLAQSTHLLLSAGRLVWEKGHQDVLRALALLHRGNIRTPDGKATRPLLRIVGSGPEYRRLRKHAEELGVAHAVEMGSVPYHEMPETLRLASALILASEPSTTGPYYPFGIPHLFWEEQFGMVLAEAMAARLAIISTTSGAIPEVLAGAPVPLVPPGDWVSLAKELAHGPLSRAPGAQVEYPIDLIRRYSTVKTTRRLEEAYERVLEFGSDLSSRIPD